MGSRNDLGTEARRRRGMESSHLAMAEHPNQGDPIVQTQMQKIRAALSGTIAPQPSSLRQTAANTLKDLAYRERAGQTKERWKKESSIETPAAPAAGMPI